MIRVLVLLVGAGCGSNSNNNNPQALPDLAEPPPDLTGRPDLTTPALIDADQSTVTADRSTGLFADGADHAVVVVTLRDAQGQTISGRVVMLTSNNQGAFSPASGSSDSGGRFQSQLSSMHVENDTVTATAEQPGAAPVILNMRPQVAFVSLAPAQVVFASQPAAQTAGNLLASIAVKVVDSQNHTVPSFAPAVSITLGMGAGAPLSGNATLATTQGGVSFDTLEIDRAGSYTLLVSAAGLTGSESASFTISPAAAAKLGFQSAPGRVTVGFPMQPSVTVGVQDNFGNSVGSSASMTLSIGTDPAGGSSLGGTLTRSAAGGVATFDDLTVNRLGDGFTLRAHGAGLADGLSAPINVRNSFVRVNSGLFGGWVRALAIDPRNNSQLYACVQGGGLSMSSDAGLSWSDAGSGLDYDYLSAVVVDGKANPSVVTAATIGGAFRSTNGGAAWSKITAGLPQEFVTVMAIDPSPSPSPSPAVLYAGTSGGGVYARRDDGASAFTAVPATGLSGAAITSLLVDSSQSPGTLWVSTLNGAFTMATNGTSWTALPTTGLPGTGIHALVFDKSTDPYTLYAAAAGDVVMMAENGASWSSAGTGLPFNPVTLAVDSTVNPAVVYAGTAGGVYKLSGGTWSLSVSAFGPAESLALDSTQPVPILYAGGRETGVFSSTDRGGGWGTRRNGMEHVQIHALALNTAGTILRAGVYGIYTSSNGGTFWSEDGSGADFVSVTSLMYSDRTATFFAASITDNAIFSRGASDGVWSAEGPNLPAGSGVTAMTLDDISAAQHLYVAGTGNTGRFYDAIVSNTWNTDTGPALSGLSTATDNRPNPPVVYLGTTDGLYVFAGGNYSAFSTTGLTNTHINAVVIDSSTNPSTLVVGTPNGIFTAPTNGTWTAGNVTSTIYTLAVDGVFENLYAGGQEGLSRSTDHGATWTVADTGLGVGRPSKSTPPVYSLATDPSTPATLYVGSEATGVFKSISHGQ